MADSTKAIYDELLRIAKNDEVITNDEEVLIDNIMKNVHQYYKILDEFQQDGVVDSNEHHQLYSQRKKILEEAIELARNDQEVTKEEFNLLMGLRKIIAGIEKGE
ncbi:MAG: hypothetical protein IH840_08585 [Candidatus Heimdallarchaeota archaeon]|nr:hypothetical protein [Candidatus Heimdallarchaeota archaeon]